MTIESHLAWKTIGAAPSVSIADALMGADAVSEQKSRLSVSLVSINYAPELTGIGVYSTGLAEHLARRGHKVTVYTGFPYYPNWTKAEEDQAAMFRSERAGSIKLRRSYLYVPKRVSVLRRILHELSFVASASLNYLMGPRSDVTIIVSPPLFLGIPIALLARLKGSRTLFHVQDLQPDAAVDLGMLKPGLVTRTLFRIERLTYALVDAVSSISGSMLRKIEEKGVPAEKLRLFPNWANDNLVTPMPVESSFKGEWDLNDKFVVLYSGNMGVKQGLDSLLHVADALREHKDVAFVVVGDGGEKAQLMQRAIDLNLDNVVFKPLQPLTELSKLLATADVSVIPQKAGVADIVLPSKLPNMMSSGRAVVAMAEPRTELHRIVQEAECGKVVAPGDVNAMGQAILDLKASDAHRVAQGENGRRYVLRKLSESAVLESFESWLRVWARAPRFVKPRRSLAKSG